MRPSITLQLVAIVWTQKLTFLGNLVNVASLDLTRNTEKEVQAKDHHADTVQNVNGKYQVGAKFVIRQTTSGLLQAGYLSGQRTRGWLLEKAGLDDTWGGYSSEKGIEEIGFGRGRRPGI